MKVVPHKITIENKAEGHFSTGFNTRVLLDGEVLRGCKSIKFEATADKIATCTIEMFADVAIKDIQANVKINDENDVCNVEKNAIDYKVLLDSADFRKFLSPRILEFYSHDSNIANGQTLNSSEDTIDGVKYTYYAQIVEFAGCQPEYFLEVMGKKYEEYAATLNDIFEKHIVMKALNKPMELKLLAKNELSDRFLLITYFYLKDLPEGLPVKDRGHCVGD